MSSYTYEPIDYDKPCGAGEVREKEYPSMHVDVGPGQLKGLEVGADVEIVIRGKVKSMRYDTDDNWGTGASIGVSLRSCDIKDSQEQSVIDSMIDEG